MDLISWYLWSSVTRFLGKKKRRELDNIRLTWSWLQGKSYEVDQIVKLENKIFPTLNMIYTTQWLIQHEEIKVSNVEDEKLDGQTSFKDFHIATIYKLPR